MAFCTVTQSIYTYVVDDSDEGREPQKVPANGRVIFTPVLGRGETVTVVTDGGAETISLVPIEARITGGEIYHRGEQGILLYAGGDGATPTPIQYKATYQNLVAGTHPLALKDLTFTSIPGGTLDLTGEQQ